MILLGFGSSLPFCGGSPRETVERAIRAVEAIAPVALVSRFYATPAWPDPLDPPFVNAAVALASAPPPHELMASLHRIEAAFGRKRGAPNAPRTLDIDLLTYRQEILEGALTVPHPGLSRRAFVLAPLADIVPEYRPPGFRLTIAEMLAALGPIEATPLVRR